MSVTITNKRNDLTRTQRLVTCDVTFDSSYATGGESPSQGDFKTALGFSSINRVILGTKGGYQFEYDYTNHKIKVYKPNAMPPIVVAERHVLDANDQFTTNYPPAYVMDINNGTSPLALGTTGVTLVAGQAKPTALFDGKCATFDVSPTNILSGTFASDAGWTDTGEDWSNSEGTATKAATGTGAMSFDTWAAILGDTYRAGFTIENATGTEGCTLTVGGAGTARVPDAAAATTYIEDVVATGATGIIFTPAGDDAFTLTLPIVQSRVVYITYITQGWSEVWENVVQEEVVTVATHNGTLANTPLAFQAVTSIGTTSTNSCLFLDQGDTAATGEVVVFKASAGITFAAADVVTSAVVTYIKKPSTGFLADRLVSDEQMSATSNVCYPAKPLLLWSYSGQVVEDGAVTNRTIHMDAVKLTNNAQLDLLSQAIVTTKGLHRILSDGVTTGTGYYVYGLPWEVPPVGMVEVASGTDLSSLTTQCTFIGS